MKKIIELINQISKIVVEDKTQQEERRKRGENFNIFKVLGLSSSEVRLHSAFLAELLNPNGDHGLEDLFLKAFIDIVIGKNTNLDFDTKSAKTYVEYDIGTISEDYKEGGRIDILISDKNGKSIIIENKIYAGDQPWQMFRYNRFAEKSNSKDNYILLYLTLDRREPSEKSTGSKPSFCYYCISYKKEILDWLRHCIGIAALYPTIRETISQYIINLKQILNVMSENNNQSTINYLIDKSNIEATVSILSLSSDIGNSIRQNFIEDKLKKLATKYNMEFNYDKEFPLLPSGRQPKYKKIVYMLPNYPNVYFAMEQENNEVSYGIQQLYGCTVNKNQFADWSDGINDSWPYGWKYFPNNFRWWDNWETLIDMVKGEIIVNTIDNELKRVIENHLIENLDKVIYNRK